MTSTASPPQPQQPPEPQKDRSTGRLLLLIGLPILAVLVVLGLAATTVAFVLPIAFRGAVDQRSVVAGSPQVSVAAENARFDVSPSTDGRIHVRITGRAFGRPHLSVTTDGGTTALRVRCPTRILFSDCGLRIALTMPADSGLTVTGTNGNVGVRGIAAPVAATTTNGALDVRGAAGTVALRTTNGAIRLTDATSAAVQAQTVNGSVDLGFSSAPGTVTARTTNGGVTVRVPGTETYTVTAHTTNGAVDTSQVRTDPAAAHHIEAESVNGTVRVVPAG